MKKESRTHPTFLKRSPQTSAAIPIICCTLHSEKKKHCSIAVQKTQVKYFTDFPLF